MPNISIKDVPQLWLEALRQRAASNHRSLQGELMSLIEQALVPLETGGAVSTKSPIPNIATGASTGGSGRPTIAGFDRQGYPIVRTGWKTVEQVVAEMNAKYPEPVTDVPLGVDIIRADRDSR